MFNDFARQFAAVREWYPIEKFDSYEPTGAWLDAPAKRGGVKGNKAQRKSQRAARRHNR